MLMTTINSSKLKPRRLLKEQVVVPGQDASFVGVIRFSVALVSPPNTG